MSYKIVTKNSRYLLNSDSLVSYNVLTNNSLGTHMALTPAQRQAAAKLRAKQHVEKIELQLIEMSVLVAARDKEIETLSEKLKKADSKLHKLEVSALKAQIKKA